jgi:hypothetical protein
MQDLKELNDLRKNAGRINQKEVATLYGQPPSPRPSKAKNRKAISKSRLDTIRKYSGRANQRTLAAQEKKPVRKRAGEK